MISSKYPLSTNFSYYDSKNNKNNVFIYNKIKNTNIEAIIWKINFYTKYIK